MKSEQILKRLQHQLRNPYRSAIKSIVSQIESSADIDDHFNLTEQQFTDRVLKPAIRHFWQRNKKRFVDHQEIQQMKLEEMLHEARMIKQQGGEQ